MIRGILIPVEGPLSVVQYDPESLEQVRVAVGAPKGYVERVRVGLSEALLVHEEGQRHRLSVNPRAGSIYGTPMHGNHIYGNAVFAYERDLGGEVDFVDIPEPDRAMEILYGTFVVMGVDQEDSAEHESLSQTAQDIADLRAASRVLAKEPSSISLHTGGLLAAMADRAESISEGAPRFSGSAEVVRGNIPGFPEAVNLANAIVRDRAK